MKRTQRGIGFLGLVFVLAVIALVTLVGLKLTPAYIDYFTIKKTIAAIAKSNPASAHDVRQAFDRAANIDRIDEITGRDLTVTGNAPMMTISFAYDKKVRLFGNISLVIEFEGSTNTSGSRF